MIASWFRFGAVGALALALAVAAAGCGPTDGLAREAVSGFVTLDGEPLGAASITFIRTDDGAPDVASGVIRNGRFSIPRAAGPAPGIHLVKISAIAIGQANPDETSGAPSRINRETIPEKYNSLTILNAEIRARQPNELIFNLATDDE